MPAQGAGGRCVRGPGQAQVAGFQAAGQAAAQACQGPHSWGLNGSQMESGGLFGTWASRRAAGRWRLGGFCHEKQDPA